jgi:3-phenylpropionate/cinnamic acid dioxygenase small subunit
MAASGTVECNALVREDRIHSSVHADLQILKDEMERTFHRGWIFVDHASEIPVYRMTSGVAWAQQPRSRTRRLIANVEVRESDGGYAVESNCVIAELRRSRQNIFAARMLRTLRPSSDSFRIALKKVLLLNNDEPIDNLTFRVCSLSDSDFALRTQRAN